MKMRQKMPAGNYIFKVYNRRNTRTRCELCLKLTIKTLKRRHWRRSGVFAFNFEHYFTPRSSFSSVNFEQVNVSWRVYGIWGNQYLRRWCAMKSSLFHGYFISLFYRSEINYKVQVFNRWLFMRTVADWWRLLFLN